MQPQIIHGIFLPKKFFITTGVATSSVSPLNAFDAALVKAGIAQCNLVNVSSILPPDAELVESVPITPGTITFTVMARMDGAPGETIGKLELDGLGLNLKKKNMVLLLKLMDIKIKKP